MDQTFLWAGSLIATFGYLGLGLIVFVNILGVPIASELTLPLAGIAIHDGKFDPTVALFTVIVVQMLAFVIDYLLARHAGVGLIEKYGHYMFISHKQVLTGQRLFKKHGPIIMLIGLCTPGMHGYMGYSAGLAKMRVHVFLLVALAGTAIWSMALMGLGYLFGDHLPQVMEFGNRAGLAIGIMAGSVGLLIWYSRLHRPKTSIRRRTPLRRAQVAAKPR